MSPEERREGAWRLLLALDGVDDGLLAGAEGSRPRRRGRGAVRVALAALLAALLCLGTALAVSPQLRQAVISLLRLPRAEELPAPSPGGETDMVSWLGSRSLGGGLTVDYYRVGDFFSESGGGVARYDEARGLAELYLLDGSRVERLAAREARLTYAWAGHTYDIRFQWCRAGETAYVYALDNTAPDREESWYLTPLDGRDDAVLLRVAYGSQSGYTEHAALLRLDTLEVEELFTGQEAAVPGGVAWTEFSPGGRYALLTAREGRGFYCCDLAAGTVRPLEELTGFAVDGAYFLDGETLFCGVRGENGGCTVWALSLADGSLRQTVSAPQELSRGTDWGLYFTGGRYGVLVGADGSVSVPDFLTGAETPVEGFSWPAGGSVLASPAGDRLLFLTFGGGDGPWISQMGVLDLEEGSFIAFDREGEQIPAESSVGWMDNRRVAVCAGAGEESYLYLYSVEE